MATENGPDTVTFAVAANRTVRLDTKGFCIFCLKRDNHSLTTSEDDAHEFKIDVRQLKGEIQLRQQFSRVISRYLGTKFAFLNTHQNDNSIDNDDKGGFLNKRFEVVPEIDVSVICKDCSILVESICHLFHEMKRLEMTLDWKTRQLKNITAFAKRAPTRVKIFRERFSDSGTFEDMEALERVEMFRKDFLEKCSKKFRKVQPRIILKRRGDPLSKSSPRKNAKKIVQNITLCDVEVQTEPVSIEKDRTLASRNQNNNISKKSQKRLKKGRSFGSSVDCQVEEHDRDTTHNASRSPSPPSLSPVNLSDGQEDEEENSQCFLRIRTIESLASPTKSVTEESPGRKTRSSSRISPANSSLTTQDNKIAGIVLRKIEKLPTRRANESKSVPDIVASSSTPAPSSSSTTAPVIDLRSKKATLTEWLQSTFNCDKCNKMFISEATLNVHKTTCGVEQIRQADESVYQNDDESMELNDDDYGESPMEVSKSQAEDSSEEEEEHEDPLGETSGDPKQGEEVIVENPETEKPSNKTFTTIRILTNNTTSSTSSTKKSTTSSTRYCKYCNSSCEKSHFMRHRRTIKHRQFKRVYKKAKKLRMLTNSTAATATTTTTTTTNIPTTTTTHHSSNAVVTVSREESNVKVVKIIYVANNGTAGESQDISSNESQEKNSNNGASEKTNENLQTQINASNEIIDISDD